MFPNHVISIFDSSWTIFLFPLFLCLFLHHELCMFFLYVILVVDKCTYASHCDECASYLTLRPSTSFLYHSPPHFPAFLCSAERLHSCCVSFVLHGEYELKCIEYNFGSSASFIWLLFEYNSMHRAAICCWCGHSVWCDYCIHLSLA